MGNGDKGYKAIEAAASEAAEYESAALTKLTIGTSNDASHIRIFFHHPDGTEAYHFDLERRFIPGFARALMGHYAGAERLNRAIDGGAKIAKPKPGKIV